MKRIFGRDRRVSTREKKLLLRRTRKGDKKPVLFLIGPSGQVVRAQPGVRQSERGPVRPD